MYAYDFQTNRIPGDPAGAPVYWRDVGTIDAYYDASMDLRSVTPALNLYNQQWPLRTASYDDPPAKFTFDEEGPRGNAIDSIIFGGCILSGGMVRNSVSGGASESTPAPKSRIPSSSTTAILAGAARFGARSWIRT